MGAHVRAGLVRDLAEVAERQLVEPERLVVDVEGAPTTAPRLHAGGPGKTALDRVAAEADAAQGEGDDGRVVDVRIEVVLELECPTARRQVGLANRPVPGDGYLLGAEPLAGPG